MTNIGRDAFRNCDNLASVKVGKNVSSIGDHAFFNCASLNSIVLPKKLESIGDYAFSGCGGINSVHITDLASWCSIVFGESSNPLFNAQHLYVNDEEVGQFSDEEIDTLENGSVDEIVELLENIIENGNDND